METGHGVSHSVDERGILRITFDRPGERVNLLNAAVLEAVARILDDARGADNVRGLLFRSAKPGMFIAGMDVEEIAAVDDAYRASEGARLGQGVFQRIEDFGRPSVCAIGGTCLGGALELALACTFRVAAEDPAVQIGLPEVRLGIIPGFGGSQRLPRVVGLTTALDLILTGRSLDARRAKKAGLVDVVCPTAYLDREATALLERAIEEGVGPTAARLRKPRPWPQRLMENVAPLRRYVIEQARKRTASKARPEDYPAPFRALEAIEAALSQPLRQGLDLEARIVGELVPTATSKNLIWLFKSQNALKRDGGGAQAAPRRVRRMAVIGAGIMGGGIAQLAADREITVRLKDIRYEAILTALKTARKIWDYKLKRKRITPRELDQKMACIAPTLDDTGLRRVDVVIEAVVENLEVKRRVLAAVEEVADERTIFATNTSSLPIGEIAAKALRPERVVGLHFFNPVNRMPLVEVIAGKRTSPESVATVHALAVRLGKVPVVVEDRPGFLVNRILTPYLNEAMQLVTEGARIEAVDQAMVAFGMPMGPLALMDQIGLDTCKHVGEVLQAAFGERVGSTGAVILALVGDGRLGDKSAKGFYRYRGGKRAAADTAVYELLGVKAARDLPPETLQERMVMVMLNEAAICLQEGVVREPRDVDMAMVMGTGFPPFRGGLLRYADTVGIPMIADRLRRLADAHGERFRPAELWASMVRSQQRFYDA